VFAVKVTHITSRENPLVQRLRKLTQTPGAYRKLEQVWLEGDHLCRAYLQRLADRAQVIDAVVSDSAWASGAHADWLGALPSVAVVADALFEQFSALESPARIGLLIKAPVAPALDPQAATVVLDRLQDAGNVGSILRSASAFGFKQVLALQGTAALWSPKVVRAGMGAHFGLHLIEGMPIDQLAELAVPLVATSSHADQLLGDAPPPWPCAWVLGHEGQGVAAAVLAHCAKTLRIEQPGGEESLNVAAAAAVCLHATRRRHGGASA
jgi:RNA methyltransferase, TrmH family